jgi:Domain of unknown function (DUF4112)
VQRARKADIPPWLLRRMLLNNAVSAGVGFVPVVGDVILAMYKANSRNAALLEEFLRIRGDQFLKMQEQERVTQGLQSGALGDFGQKKDTSKKDVEQVKPGAGIVKGEVVPTERTMSTAIKDSEKNQTQGKTSGSGTKLFGLFGSGKSDIDGKAPPQGRFVEDVGPTTTSSQEAQ